MKTVLGVLGVLLILAGVVWFLQGIGLLPGSFMSSQAFWAVAGFLSVIAGIALVRRWRLRVPSSPSDDAGFDRPEQKL